MDINSLEILLSTMGKHQAYQELPPRLLLKMPHLNKYSCSRRMDLYRYRWIVSNLSFMNKSVVDIGANIGYFSVRLTLEERARVTAYEPFKPHAEVIVQLKSILDLNNYQLNICAKGISLEDVEILPEHDITLLLNVLHHAGEDFNTDLVKSSEEWYNYAVSYLKKIGLKSQCLVFQIGYTWLGHASKLCKNDEIISFTIDLLKQAGWRPTNLGVLSKPWPSEYINYNIKFRGNHPLNTRIVNLFCKASNKLWNRKFDLRFAMRPLLICERR